MSAGTAHRSVGVGPRGGPVEIRTCKEGIGSPEFPCNQAGITGVLLKTNGNAVSPDPSGLFCGRPHHLSPKAFHFCRHSLLHGCGRSRCRRSGFLLCRELVIANPMSGLRWQVVLVVTTGQYALSRFKGGVAMSNFIQCNTETGEVI